MIERMHRKLPITYFRNMKTKIISLAIVACATISLHAQDAVKPTKDAALQEQRDVKNSADRADSRVEQMAQDLGLSADQTKQVQHVEREYQHNMDKLQRSTTEKEALQAEAARMREMRDTRLQGILTGEQYEKMMAIRKRNAEESKKKEAEIQR